MEPIFYVFDTYVEAWIADAILTKNTTQAYLSNGGMEGCLGFANPRQRNGTQGDGKWVIPKPYENEMWKTLHLDFLEYTEEPYNMYWFPVEEY